MPIAPQPPPNPTPPATALSSVAFVAVVAMAVMVSGVLMTFAMSAHDLAGGAGAPAIPATPVVAATAGARHQEPLTSTPAPPPSPTSPVTDRRPRAEQVRALGALVRRGSAAQRHTDTAVDEVLACGDLARAQDRLRAAVAARSGVLTRLDVLDVSALPGGRAAVGDLKEFHQISLRADQAYLQWALASAWSCSHDPVPGEDLSWSRALRFSAQARAAGQRFDTRWNRIKP